MTTKEIINLYLAGDYSYGMALEALIETGMLAEDACRILDDIDCDLTTN